MSSDKETCCDESSDDSCSFVGKLEEDKYILSTLGKLEDWICKNFGKFVPESLNLGVYLQSLEREMLDPMLLQNCSFISEKYYTFHWSFVMALLSILDCKMLEQDFFMCLFYCLIFSLKFNDDEHFQNCEYSNLLGIPMDLFVYYEWEFLEAFKYDVSIDHNVQIELEKLLRF
jgi:hypothetical protein